MGFVDQQDSPPRQRERAYETPAHLAKLVRVRAIGKAFRAHGRRIEPGEIVWLPNHVARDLAFLKRGKEVE